MKRAAAVAFGERTQVLPTPGSPSPDVKRDAVKLLDAPAVGGNGNLTTTEPDR